MLNSKYLILGVMTLSPCAYGADGTKVVSQASSSYSAMGYKAITTETSEAASSADEISLLDCFQKKTIRVPGAGFCAPIAISQVFIDPPKEQTLWQLLTNEPRNPVRKTIKIIVGFVEGPDKKLTDQIAQHIMQNLKITKYMSESDVKREINLDNARRAVIKGDVTQFDKVKYTECGGFLILQSTNNKPEPVQDKSYYYHAGIHGRLKAPKFKPFESTVLPPSVVAGFKRLSQFHTTDIPIEQKLNDLAKYAATQLSSHETFFFEFDRECYNKFLAQKFSNTTN